MPDYPNYEVRYRIMKASGQQCGSEFKQGEYANVINSLTALATNETILHWIEIDEGEGWRPQGTLVEAAETWLWLTNHSLFQARTKRHNDLLAIESNRAIQQALDEYYLLSFRAMGAKTTIIDHSQFGDTHTLVWGEWRQDYYSKG